MSDEWNWGQEPEKTDGSSQQPENTDCLLYTSDAADEL